MGNFCRGRRDSAHELKVNSDKFCNPRREQKKQRMRRCNVIIFKFRVMGDFAVVAPRDAICVSELSLSLDFIFSLSPHEHLAASARHLIDVIVTRRQRQN